MSTDEFNKFFDSILNSRIPSDPREMIKSYWKRFNVNPSLVVDDRAIDVKEKESGKKIATACVGGIVCYHVFYFREFLIATAPEDVLATVVQHELIHCYFHSSNSVENLLASKLIASPKSSGLTHLALNILSEQVDEHWVFKVNSLWGGDESAARSWLISRGSSLG